MYMGENPSKLHLPMKGSTESMAAEGGRAFYMERHLIGFPILSDQSYTHVHTGNIN